MNVRARQPFVPTLLPLLGVWTLAVAQPILDLLQRSPEFFVAHRAEPAEIVGVVAALVLVPPIALAIVVWLTGRSVFRAILALLGAALAVQIARRAGIETAAIAIPAALVAGLLTAYAYDRIAAVRTLASVLSIAAIVTPAVFLTRPGIRPLVWPARQHVAGDSAGTGGTPAPTPILMVIVDETSLVSLVDAEGKIDPVLYPNMARLARDGVWFRNATAVADFTRWAVPAIVSGRYPEAARLPNAADHPDNLFTWLARTHRMEVVETVTRLCPREICRAETAGSGTHAEAMARDLVIIYLHVLATDDLRPRLPSITSDWARFGREEADRTRRDRRASDPRPDKYQIALTFADWISADDAQPTFYFFHTLLTHSPWEWLPSGQRNATRTPIPGDKTWSWTDEEWGVAQYYQRHLLQVGLVDRALGRIIERLEEAGLYERALVIVTADHGVSFRPGGQRRNFTTANAADIMRIPLFVKVPSSTFPPRPDVMIGGQKIIDRNVETIDIAPTVAHVLGTILPWKTDGQSMLDATRPPRASKKIYFASAQRMREFRDDAPPLAPAVQWKIQRFGGSDNVYRVPRPARFAELVGQPLGALRVEAGGPHAVITNGSAFEHVDPRADLVPFDVAGEITPARSTEPTYIAVAVNGTIRAVTQTWRSEPARWVATPPLDSWRPGANHVEAFAVESDPHGAILRSGGRP